MDWILIEHGLNIAIDILLVTAAGILVWYFWKEWRQG